MHALTTEDVTFGVLKFDPLFYTNIPSQLVPFFCDTLQVTARTAVQFAAEGTPALSPYMQ